MFRSRKTSASEKLVNDRSVFAIKLALTKCLSYFHRIEERGSGFRRMRDQMLNHNLDQPLLDTNTGYFQVTFPGPGVTSIASAWRKPVSW